MKTQTMPQYKPVKYIHNAQTGTYTSDQIDVLKSPLKVLTDELILVPAGDNNTSPQPAYLLRSTKYKKGVCGFITNLFSAGVPGWYVGYHVSNKDNARITNTVLVKTGIKPKTLQVYYFLAPDRFTITERIAFAKYAIPKITGNIVTNV